VLARLNASLPITRAIFAINYGGARGGVMAKMARVIGKLAFNRANTFAG
jgi:hypothetical protein